MDAAGDFTVVWEGSGPDGRVRYLGTTVQLVAVAQGGQFVVNSYTTNTQILPKIAMDPAGAFVVTGKSYLQDGSRYGIYGKEYMRWRGSRIEFQANTYTTNSQTLPAIAIDAAGSFVVAWESYGQDGSRSGIYEQLFAPTGGGNVAPMGTPNTVTTLHNVPYVFFCRRLWISDPGNTPPNTLLNVIVTTLPGLGYLTDNGVQIAARAKVSLADITSGKFKYIPPSVATGTPLTSFTFQVQDNGGLRQGAMTRTRLRKR